MKRLSLLHVTAAEYQDNKMLGKIASPQC